MDKTSPDRRQRKRQHTASHISATAFSLFESAGYDAVSMEQIAAAADVAKATLYNYFPVKEALIAHRFREDIATGMADRAKALSAHASFDARMRYLLRESADWHSERKAYLPQYLRFLTSQAHYIREPGQDPLCHSDTQRILAGMIHAGQSSGEVATTQTAEQIAWSFEYLLFGAMAAWLSDPKESLSQRFLAAFDILMHGVSIAPSGKSSKPNAGRRK